MPAKKKKKTTTTSTPAQFTVTADGLNMRDAPGLHGNVVKLLARDTVVEHIDTSGDGYWYKIRSGGNTGWAAHKYLMPVVVHSPASRFAWVAIATGEIGTREATGSGDNPRVVEYLRSTNLDAPMASQDETPWCSAFVNWCVERSGSAGTDSAAARSWLKWGVATNAPETGCVTVFERGVTSGHVAFFVSRTAAKIKVLGGNQGDAVCVAEYPATRLLGYRLPG